MSSYKLFRNFKFLAFGIALMAFFACSDDLNMNFPVGPQGPAGLSAYELWVQAVNDGTVDWNKDQTDLVDFFVYLKGQDGKDGVDGRDGQDGTDGVDGVDGQSAYDLWVEMVTSTEGLDDPHNPGLTWPKDQISEQDFWAYLSGADGKNGTTPHIGDNDNWWIGDEDTGVPARGLDGEDGEDGQDGVSPHVGDNGNWWIGDTDTGIPATGASAYELWVIEVDKGLLNPHAKDGSDWPKDETELTDFWEYLRGEDGKDTETVVVDSIMVVVGRPNVIARYYQSGYSTSSAYVEYVNAIDGSVRYTVYNENAEIYPNANVRVSINGQVYEFQSDSNGDFFIEKEMLPVDSPITKSCEVEIDGEYKTTPVNMYIPVRAQVKIEFSKSNLTTETQAFYTYVSRSMDGGQNWEIIPDYLVYNTVSLYLYEVAIAADGTVDMTYNNSYVKRTQTTNLYSYSRNTTSTITFSINRPIKERENFEIPASRKWDEEQHYYAVYLDKLYGEQLFSENISQLAPIQPAPLMGNITIEAEKYNTAHNVWQADNISGTFILNGIDDNLLFEDILVLDATSFSLPCYVGEINSSIKSDTAKLFRNLTRKSFADGASDLIYSSYANFVDPVFASSCVYDAGTFDFISSNLFVKTYSYKTTRTDVNTWLFKMSDVIGTVTDVQYKEITVTIR